MICASPPPLPLSPPKQQHTKNSSGAAKAAPAQQQVAAARRASVAARYAPVEVAQVAGEAGFIAGVALTMMAITLLVSFFFFLPEGGRRGGREGAAAAPGRSPRVWLIVLLHPTSNHKTTTITGPLRRLRAAARRVARRGGQALGGRAFFESSLFRSPASARARGSRACGAGGARRAALSSLSRPGFVAWAHFSQGDRSARSLF